jgi:polar amino acid transport system substrate-binding protein
MKIKGGFKMQKLLVTIVLLAFSTLSFGKSIKLATLEWAPFVGKSLKNQGFTTDIIKHAFEAADYKVKIRFVPWKRVLSQVKKGKMDAGYPAYDSVDRRKIYNYSKTFGSGPIVLFKRKDRNITWKTLDDLKKFKLGVVRGYVNSKEFDARKDFNKRIVNKDFQLLVMLQKGKIDFASMDKAAGVHLLNTHAKLIPIKNEIDYVNNPLVDHKLFLIFSKKANGSDQKLKDFNAGLAKIRSDGTFDKILKDHGLN